jgi:ATP-dependent DNA ligase
MARMPLAALPPRDSRFGSPLQLSKVHWVRPELVVEVTDLTWTEDNLLRQVSYQGQREDKPARQVVRPIPHPLWPNYAAATEDTLPAFRIYKE